MKTKLCSALLLLLLGSPVGAVADDSAPASAGFAQRDWHVGASVLYSSRSMDGSIVDRTPIRDDAFGSLVATGDSMDLGTSDTFMLTLAAQYRRWTFGLNYLPTSFSGEGTALVTLDGGGGAGVTVRTPLKSDIDVDMLLASVLYGVIRTPESRLAVGVGLGRTAVDLSIVPEVGEPILYKGDQPFGFLSLQMANRHGAFLYGFGVNGISGSFEGVAIDYSDYKLDLGYRLVDRDYKLDLVGGYRQVNFSMDLEYGRDVVKTRVVLKGPFLGLSALY